MYYDFMISPGRVVDGGGDPERSLQFVVRVAQSVTPEEGVEPVVGAGLD